MVNRNGRPGRAPKTRHPLIRGVGGGGGVRASPRPPPSWTAAIRRAERSSDASSWLSLPCGVPCARTGYRGRGAAAKGFPAADRAVVKMDKSTPFAIELDTALESAVNPLRLPVHDTPFGWIGAQRRGSGPRVRGGRPFDARVSGAASPATSCTPGCRSSVSIQKTMNLGGLPAARQAARPRPSWCASSPRRSPASSPPGPTCAGPSSPSPASASITNQRRRPTSSWRRQPGRRNRPRHGPSQATGYGAPAGHRSHALRLPRRPGGPRPPLPPRPGTGAAAGFRPPPGLVVAAQRLRPHAIPLFRDVRRNHGRRPGASIRCGPSPRGLCCCTTAPSTRGARDHASDLRPPRPRRLRAGDGAGGDGADPANGNRRGAGSLAEREPAAPLPRAG